VSPKK
jgi:hypothetical protein